MEVEAAISRINWRHRHVDDPRRSDMGTEPRDVLDYLIKRSVGLPRWVAAADTQDALVLLTWLWWEDRRRERALLRRGLHLGLTATELGAPLGVASRQGLRDRLDRLDALLAFDRPDEKLTRAIRREAAQHDPRQRWVNAHRQRIRSVLAELLNQTVRVFGADVRLDQVPVGVDGGGLVDTDVLGDRNRAPEKPRLDDEPATEPDAEAESDDWLAELRTDLDEDALTPATLAMLGLTLTPLRIAAQAAGLDPAHGLARALRAADALRSDFARAGTHPEPDEEDD